MKCYLTKDIDKIIAEDPEIISWVDLYDKLGIAEYLLKKGIFDVKHIYCTPSVLTRIDKMLGDKIAISKDRRVLPYKPFYRARMHSMDSLCYSPTFCSNKYKKGIYVSIHADLKIPKEELDEHLKKEAK